jgi:hypothetical protein
LHYGTALSLAMRRKARSSPSAGAACHLVSSDQTQANSDAPSRLGCAQDKVLESAHGFLTDPHPKMPDMNLTREEIASIVAYIKSLDRWACSCRLVTQRKSNSNGALLSLAIMEGRALRIRAKYASFCI